MAAPHPTPSSNPTVQSHRRHRRSSSAPTSTTCNRSSVMIIVDIAMLIAVVLACGYLAMPCFQLFYDVLSSAFAAGISAKPVALICAAAGLVALGLGVVVAAFVMEGRKCENPNCLGLRDAPEFDVKIETEEMWEKSDRDGLDGVFFELNGEHNRELEAKLKKMAPPNGRAVLVFRAKCGCSAGKMVVWGPRKGRRSKKQRAEGISGEIETSG